jgi:predicted DNA-binding transcriptional regulator YafY
VPWPYEVEVLLDLPLDEVTRRLPATLAELSEEDGGTLLRMRVSSLDWTARVLAGLGCDFTIVRPEELRASVRVFAERLSGCADRGEVVSASSS